ncbi:hypothetical protein LBYS11_16340 [Lysinibacillus sp. YS11]|uniref:hypothetical protein n=1 Tax=Lysinibacillus sp. YS11 TaxID=2072025 RepID=UPI000CA1C87E|nr:hypothetical protein [Lysinibacillus sp. YS11]AUS87807.1 hypothetical protein LBYS11_16340 [Lysinibacillus sp. YS11]
MNHKKNNKFQILAILLMISLLVAAFVIFYSGHYMVGSALFVVFMLILNGISSWKKMKNDEYIHMKNYKNNEKW